MDYQTSRRIARWMHIFIACYQLVFIYTPLHDWQYGLTVVQWITFPLLTISGVWLWKGGRIWHRFAPGVHEVVEMHNAKRAA